MGETMGPSPEEMGLKPEPTIDLEGGQQVPKPEFAPNLDRKVKTMSKGAGSEFVESLMGFDDLTGKVYEDVISPERMEVILRALEVAMVPGAAAVVMHSAKDEGLMSSDYKNTAQVMKDFIAAARERLKGPKASE